MHDFSTMVGPLTDQTKKGMPNKVVWTDRCREFLGKIQAVLSSDPVLRLADLSKTFTVKTDASSTGIGGVLCQDFDSQLHPVQYAVNYLTGKDNTLPLNVNVCILSGPTTNSLDTCGVGSLRWKPTTNR